MMAFPSSFSSRRSDHAENDEVDKNNTILLVGLKEWSSTGDRWGRAKKEG
jgi:hypothetical protein